jgi:hypothetical protein
MSTKTFIVTGLILAVVLGGGIFSFLNFGSYAKILTERIASRTLNVAVSIGSLDVVIREKTVLLKDLRIGNPAGYKTPYAAKIDTITLKAHTLSEALLRFSDIRVTGAEMFLEVHPAGTNLTDIKKQVNAKAAAGDQAARQIKVIIENLRMEKLKVIPSILIAGKNLTPIVMPDIILRDIGVRENGVLAQDAIGQIWADTVRRVSQEANQAGLLEGLSDQALKDIGATRMQQIRDQVSHGMDRLGNDFKRIIGD